MWQKILKQRDRPFYVEEVEGGKLLRLEGYDAKINNRFPVHALLLPQEDGNKIVPSASIYEAIHTDAAIEKSIGFLNGIVNSNSAHISNIEMDGAFPDATLRIDIISKSDERYQIKVRTGLVNADSIHVYGKYAGIDIYLCIDAQVHLPVGDILGSYIMSLIDDENSCADISTLESFIDKDYYAEITCPLCNEENPIHIGDIYDEHTCQNCRIANFYDIEVGENDAGETYFPVENHYTEYRDPRSGERLEMIYDVQNLGGFGDSYFLFENGQGLLHYSWPNEIFYYGVALDVNNNYHASTGETITVKGDDYLEMSTGLYHKVMTDGSIETQGYEEAELQEEEE
mgnify:CR=1 FL=1